MTRVFIHHPAVHRRNLTAALVLCGSLVIASGCTPPPEFRLNAVEARKQEISALNGDTFSEAQLQNLGDIMVALFGTPDDPIFPYELLDEPEAGEELIDPQRLKIAAGAVSSDRDGKQRGLYREHCAHCHGVTGDGLGPTAAALNPYPRDFRMGKFKFKSTPLGKSPTRDDIRRILINGIPGTAMPSFRLLQSVDDHTVPASEEVGENTTVDSQLKHDELEALVDYVIYLSIRGQVERTLLFEMTMMSADETLINMALANTGDEEADEEFDDQLGMLYDIVAEETGRWLDAIDSKPKYDPRPESLTPGNPERQKMIDRGRDLFVGKANCHSCHGMTALGDGQTDKYDSWTDEWMLVVKDSDERMREFRELGVLKPRKAIPRNVRQGVFRGGQRPIDVFLRVKHGIEGSPMPAAPGGMSDEDLWAITEYVRQLANENSVANRTKQTNERVVN